MDAFTVAAEILGDRQLTSGQIAQLRAINQRYWQAVFVMRHSGGEQGEQGATALTAAQITELRAMLEWEIQGLRVPDQSELPKSGAN